MAGVLEQNRRKVATALTVLGAGLILVGVIVILVYQYHIYDKQYGNYFQEVTKEDNLPTAMAIRDILFWLLMIVFIFSVGTLAMMRWSRRFRRKLLRKPKPPTTVDDVWSMHRLPEDINRPDPNEYKNS
ncbi:MAG: hypothetical protein JSV03_08975 [Planctomycetota bacterium]|nr:MAG: hypothetical protein JSV03_08975 [Planctomycetota bacterium]